MVGRVVAVAAAVALAAGCGSQSEGPLALDSTRTEAFLDTLEDRTFHFFWDLTNRQNGLTPHIVRGLRNAGFTGGWLDRAP